jgi:hypothetical protein
VGRARAALLCTAPTRRALTHPLATSAEGKEEDDLRKEVKQQLKADNSRAADFSADRSVASKMISIANPMNAGSKAMGKVTGSNRYRAHEGAPLYFPGARSAALRSHSGVK